MGVCKYCGEEKELTNYYEDILEEKGSNNTSDSLDIKSDDLPV